MNNWLRYIVWGVVALIALLLLIHIATDSPTVGTIPARTSSGGTWLPSDSRLMVIIVALLLIGIIMLIARNWGAVAAAILAAALLFYFAPAINNIGSGVGSTTTASAPSITTKQCPGGSEELTLRGVNHIERVSNHPCQTRVAIQGDGCARLYNSNGAYIGRSCADTQETINGLIYAVGGERNAVVTALITVCPLGSPGRNMGSCN